MGNRRTAAGINFVRTRLFYARPSRDRDAFRIVVGLPYNRVYFILQGDVGTKFATDFLNRLCPSYYRKPAIDPHTYTDPDPRTLARDARHLSKYIFPSEYGLSSVFVLAADPKGTYQQPNYWDREQEIKVSQFPSYV